MGPRQAGKSTLVLSAPLSANRVFYSLDDLGTRERVQREPDELLAGTAAITIDEVQREPDLILAIKRAVDRMGTRRQRGRFLLTGSANLLTMKRVADSLAGRAYYVDLWPLTRQEREGRARAGLWSELIASDGSDWPGLIDGNQHTPADWKAEVRRGGFPEPALMIEDDMALPDWFEGYTRTYLERDLRDLSAVQNLVDFRRLLSATALRVGQLVNQTEIGRDVQMSQQRVHNYLNLLETSYQFVRLAPSTTSRTTRLIKTPKIYWNDAGLAFHLSGLEEPTGSHLENLILCDLLAWRAVQRRRPDVLYWRTALQQEIDFVIESDKVALPIEVKASRRLRYDDARGLQAFLAEYPQRATAGLILYDGEETRWLADRVLAAPWWKVI
jgi:predicted AAA+ superfamily ATPase